MKGIKIFLYSLVFIAAGIVFSSCGSATTNEGDAKQGKEYTSAYICPMHCEGSGSDSAGTCPVCQMAYVENTKHKSDGHDHGSHDGHGHGNHDGHDHGSHDGHDH